MFENNENIAKTTYVIWSNVKVKPLATKKVMYHIVHFENRKIFSVVPAVFLAKNNKMNVGILPS